MTTRRLITFLAHPNSLRARPGRPEYNTEAGIARRIKEGRGTGEGPDYNPWFTVSDFHSKGFRRMVWSPRLRRVVHLFSELEYRIFLWLEANGSYADIRECFPLDRAETIKIARQLGVRHPAPYGVPIVMTTDFEITVRNWAGVSTLGVAVKYERDLTNPRVLEKLAIERAYHEARGAAYLVMTENSVPVQVFQNLQFIRGALREGAMRGLDAKLLNQIEPILRSHLACATICNACAGTDSELRLPHGSSMQALRYFMATHRWQADLRCPLTPEAVINLEPSQ